MAWLEFEINVYLCIKTINRRSQSKPLYLNTALNTEGVKSTLAKFAGVDSTDETGAFYTLYRDSSIKLFPCYCARIMERQRAVSRMPGRCRGPAQARRHIHPARLHLVRGAHQLATPLGRRQSSRACAHALSGQEYGDPMGGLYAKQA